MLLLALFPVVAAIADLVSDFRSGLPTDHQETFSALTGQQWSNLQTSTPGVASYIALLETGYAIHELVFGALSWALWPSLQIASPARCKSEVA